MKQNLLLIINPVAGTKKPNKHLTDIINLFCENGYICQVHMTTPDYGADKIVEDYAKDKDMVVCIGGDGTFNEMISGLIKHNLSPTIGYIPSGSTNDFATGLGISLNPMKYVNKTVVAYKNPGHNFANPYVTSNYSGMMFNYYC